MAESFTKKRAQNNWRGHYDRAVSLATGMPLVENIGSGIWEVRSKLPTRIARTLFFVHEGEIVLLHGFVKKTRKTPKEDRALALERKNAYLKSSKN